VQVAIAHQTMKMSKQLKRGEAKLKTQKTGVGAKQSEHQQALPFEVQQRIEVIQQLLAAQGSEHYGQVQQQAALKLGRACS